MSTRARRADPRLIREDHPVTGSARAAQSGRASGEPKGRDGAVEAIRSLMVAKRSARHERTQAINQARALILTGPDELRARFAGLRAARLAEAVAALRPRPGEAADYSLRIALRELGRRVEFPDAQIERLDDLIIPLVTACAPGLLSLYGVGPLRLPGNRHALPNRRPSHQRTAFPPPAPGNNRAAGTGTGDTRSTERRTSSRNTPPARPVRGRP